MDKILSELGICKHNCKGYEEEAVIRAIRQLKMHIRLRYEYEERLEKELKELKGSKYKENPLND